MLISNFDAILLLSFCWNKFWRIWSDFFRLILVNDPSQQFATRYFFMNVFLHGHECISYWSVFLHECMLCKLFNVSNNIEYVLGWSLYLLVEEIFAYLSVRFSLRPLSVCLLPAWLGITNVQFNGINRMLLHCCLFCFLFSEVFDALLVHSFIAFFNSH